MTDPHYVEPLGGTSPDPGRLGGKGASLSRLVASGHRVPPGMIVTADAFEATVQRLGLSTVLERVGRALTGRGDPMEAGRVLREGLVGRLLPEDVLEPIVATFRSLRLLEGNPDGAIVRSSATVEDSASLSFAGIFESVVIATEEQLEPAIREVWASAFSARAMSYLTERAVTVVPSMAVVVQSFLEATRSGVMFTEFTSPEGALRILVEHVEGGCEKLVKGEVTPDRLWLEGADQVPDDLEGPLAAVHARELARLAGELQGLFGGPQDVEWVIHRGAVHLVQSRPVTASFSSRAQRRRSVEGLAPVLTGIGASPGVGVGEVYLVFNIEQALLLERGRVLVTPMTNPDMVVAMRSSAGIVTDVGGIICHAAIVSRELGLPCVVGTENATATLKAGEPVTVDGSGGVVYRGAHRIQGPESARAVEWSDVWALWHQAGKGRLPAVSSLAALEAMPPGVPLVRIVPDVDLRADGDGLWRDLEAMPPSARERLLDAYLAKVSDVAGAGPSNIEVTLPGAFSAEELAAAIERSADPRLGLPTLRDATPLVAGALLGAEPASPASRQPGVEESLGAALDTIKFFGHRPGVKMAGMPNPASRRRWWGLLPEYGRFHREFGTEQEGGEFEWLEVRPELVISALLKSLVQPGFEMVPRILGFRELPPMHVKWVRCRYHFRADTFGRVWESIVRSTYDEAFMADLMRRVRASYTHLEEVLRLFPQTEEEHSALSGDRVVALLTSWWPRWVEFFALCWFIQAQGDDIAYPFIEETVAGNLESIGDPPPGLAWPSVNDLIAATTPVMSGEYMADVGRLRDELFRSGVATREEAEAALAHSGSSALNQILAEHLRKWHWMRDRDLLFEPWDTPSRVIETALRTDPHTAPDYAENLRRNIFALSFHFDLARRSGRAETFNRMARFLHDLNVERENHHVLWLKYSYPLRRLILEVEKRLVRIDSLAPGDVFFLQAPELIDAASNLPEPLPDDLVAKVKNRRAGYLIEARLAPAGSPPASPEDDYY